MRVKRIPEKAAVRAADFDSTVIWPALHPSLKVEEYSLKVEVSAAFHKYEFALDRCGFYILCNILNIRKRY